MASAIEHKSTPPPAADPLAGLRDAFRAIVRRDAPDACKESVDFRVIVDVGETYATMSTPSGTLARVKDIDAMRLLAVGFLAQLRPHTKSSNTRVSRELARDEREFWRQYRSVTARVSGAPGPVGTPSPRATKEALDAPPTTDVLKGLNEAALRITELKPGPDGLSPSCQNTASCIRMHANRVYPLPPDDPDSDGSIDDATMYKILHPMEYYDVDLVAEVKRPPSADAPAPPAVSKPTRADVITHAGISAALVWGFLNGYRRLFELDAFDMWESASIAESEYWAEFDKTMASIKEE